MYSPSLKNELLIWKTLYHVVEKATQEYNTYRESIKPKPRDDHSLDLGNKVNEYERQLSKQEDKIISVLQQNVELNIDFDKYFSISFRINDDIFLIQNRFISNDYEEDYCVFITLLDNIIDLG